MGCTIVAARMVASLQTLKGQFYALFEQTYESNVFPKTPTWGCRYFGTIESCMSRIIHDAAATEGGILKETSGRVSPSAYIKHWRREFLWPMSLKTTIVRAKFGTGFRDLPLEKRSAVSALLEAHGLTTVDDTVELNLHQNPDTFQALIDEEKLSVWKFLSGTDFESPVQGAAIYRTAKQPSAFDDLPVSLFFLDQDNADREYWVMDENGRMAGSGWAFSTIEKLICTYAVASERSRPGSAEETIRLIRQTMGSASPLLDECPVSIQRADAKEKWHEVCYDSLARLLQRECTQISTTIGEIRKSGAVYDFTRVPSFMVRFPGLKQRPIATDLLAA